MTTWTKQQTSQLISVYKKYPNLYNTKHENYGDSRTRNETFFKIQEKLCSVRNNTSIKDIKDKIKTIKSQYNQEKKLIKKSVNSGNKIGDYKPKLWFYYDIRYIDLDNKNVDAISDKSSDEFYFDNLNDDISNDKILNDEISNNESRTLEKINNQNLTAKTLKYEIITNSEIATNEIEVDDDDENPNKNIEYKVNKISFKTQDMLEQNCQKSLQLSQESARTFQNFNRQQSHLYYFIKSIESDLLALPSRLQHEAKWKIQDIIREAQKEHMENLCACKNQNNLSTAKNCNIQIMENTKSTIAKNEYRTLKHLTMAQICSSFNDYEPMLDKHFHKFMANTLNIVPKIEGANPLTIINILNDRSENYLLTMKNKLLAHYKITPTNLRSHQFVMNLLLPEWILALYMKEYKISRINAIQELNNYDEMQISSNESVLLNNCTILTPISGQIGKPKIYQVLKPIPKHNSSSSFPPEQVSSTLILGENNYLDSSMEIL